MKPHGKHPYKRLTTVQIRNLTAPGRYADGNGLYLVVDRSGAKRWVLRAMVAGKRKDIGLGGFQKVSLTEARDKASEVHSLIRAGQDPVAARQAARRIVPTFAEAAQTVHQDQLHTWKNEKHGQQWINTITQYALPALGTLKVDAIGTPDILAVLQPIWLTKPETARRLKQRIHAILDWAKTAGYRTGENPVDGVERGLPRQPSQIDHHEALPYEQVSEFIAAVHTCPSSSSPKLGLEFLILTAARTSEVTGARWSEIDLQNACWTIPAARMKAKKEHRVPLSRRCLEILGEAQAIRAEGDYLFPGRSVRKPLSNMAFAQIVNRLGVRATVHGFRSTFRDWAAEQTHYPNEVCEQALAHSISNKVEAAYRRSDLFERRRNLMEEWSAFAAASDRNAATPEVIIEMASR